MKTIIINLLFALSTVVASAQPDTTVITDPRDFTEIKIVENHNIVVVDTIKDLDHKAIILKKGIDKTLADIDQYIKYELKQTGTVKNSIAINSIANQLQSLLNQAINDFYSETYQYHYLDTIAAKARIVELQSDTTDIAQYEIEKLKRWLSQ